MNKKKMKTDLKSCKEIFFVLLFSELESVIIIPLITTNVYTLTKQETFTAY